MIRNIDNAPVSNKNGTYGGISSLKDGLIIDGCNWLVKYPKSTVGLKRVEEMQYTNDCVSEYLGSHIYSILGYPAHDTMLVERRGKIAVACKDFCENGEILIEIRTIKNSANAKLAEILERDFNSTASNHCIELDEMLLHLDNNDILTKIPGIKERFWDMVVVDAYINNNDRNNGNWGILRDISGADRLAPIFDNGSSFNGKTPDSRLEIMLHNGEKALQDNVKNSISAFGKDDNNFSMEAILNLANDDLRAALLRNVPVIAEKRNEIFDLIDAVPAEACSGVRKEFYQKTLDIRYRDILFPAYDKAMSFSVAEDHSYHRGR